ncbi:cyclase family protein [Streptomonospora nanhaiensis]|uniref:Kynurenine formamidase n=1 Tax=Streptomonospora nanhaiensis TaxID=1323731 RepID=A0A853BG60_9ACTN|nr:cyclase family protein [Streptomonospora nanhaiensis]MBV2364383.1 cyclase family protein [Streptomonospora nanhaiensis]MBX9391345.1 cyclase family protein [Streptomonospora nanhaiensis]NYI94010.1 kynurenine formamidase [Streptomonospora nanhaiensis]
MTQLVDVSHQITSGMVTYPGLPGPEIDDHMSFEESHGTYAAGTEFTIARITMVANTGTYLDTPGHRYRDGADLADLELEKVAGLPGVVVDLPEGAREIGPDTVRDIDVAGRAVLLRTGWDRHWRTERYGDPEHPFLSGEGAKALVEAGAALVGIDSVNIDDTSPGAEGARPAHSVLLAAGIPVVEHLCLLDRLPETGFTFFAVPVKVRGMATFPVRAFAMVG